MIRVRVPPHSAVDVNDNNCWSAELADVKIDP